MVRKTIYTLFVALAATVLLGMSIVPHHHHDGVACMVNTHAALFEHNQCGDEPNSCHHCQSLLDESGRALPCEHNNSNGSSCVEDLDFFAPRSENDSHCSMCASNDLHRGSHFDLNLPLILLSSILNVDCELKVPINDSTYSGNRPNLYGSAQLTSSCGLRAPPVQLS